MKLLKPAQVTADGSAPRRAPPALAQGDLRLWVTRRPGVHRPSCASSGPGARCRLQGEPVGDPVGPVAHRLLPGHRERPCWPRTRRRPGKRPRRRVRCPAHAGKRRAPSGRAAAPAAAKAALVAAGRGLATASPGPSGGEGLRPLACGCDRRRLAWPVAIAVFLTGAMISLWVMGREGGGGSPFWRNSWEARGPEEHGQRGRSARASRRGGLACGRSGGPGSCRRATPVAAAQGQVDTLPRLPGGVGDRAGLAVRPAAGAAGGTRGPGHNLLGPQPEQAARLRTSPFGQQAGQRRAPGQAP